MSMRYLLKRSKPEDLSEVKSNFSDLDARLGAPAENLRRFLEIRLSASKVVVYQCFTQKGAAGWTWICPSIELVGESEKDFLELTDQFNVPTASLSHVPVADLNRSLGRTSKL